MARTRSVAYPSVPLQQSIEDIQTMKDKLGKGRYNRESVAQALGYGGISGSSGRRVAALVHFGLLIRRGNVYELSELADKILFYTSEEERRTAMLAAVRSPKLFASLIDEYSGQSLPIMLANILSRRYGINNTVAEDVANIFRQSLEYLSLIKNGVLQSSVKIDLEDSVSSAGEKDIADPGEVLVSASTYGIDIPLSHGIRVLFPREFAYDLATGAFRQSLQELDKAAEGLYHSKQLGDNKSSGKEGNENNDAAAS